MTLMGARGRTILAAVVLVTPGCSPGSASTPTIAPPTAAAASVAPVPPAPTPVTPPASTGLRATALPPAATVLDAGRYTRSGFEPRITFEVDAGAWQTGQLLDGFFDIQRDPGSPDVIAIQFARPDGASGSGGAVVATSSAAAAAQAIQANPGLEVLGTSDSRMSGLTGIVLEVENPTASGVHVPVLRLPPGALGIDAGRRLWIALFDTPDGLVAILVGGSVEKWDAALFAAEPVLETVTIGD